MTSGGSNLSYFPENQLTKFSAFSKINLKQTGTPNFFYEATRAIPSGLDAAK